MKRFAAFALLLAGTGIPGYCQHAGAHGGFSGHAAAPDHSAPAPGGFAHAGPVLGGGGSHSGFRPSAPNGGFRPSVPSRVTGYPRTPVTRSPINNRFSSSRLYGAPSSNLRLRGTNNNFRPEYSRNAGADRRGSDRRDPDRRDHDRDRDRRRDRDRESAFQWFVPYYLGYPYASSYLGYPLDFGYGDYGSYDDSANSQNAPYYAPDEYGGYDEQSADSDQPPSYRPYYGDSQPAAEPANEATVTLVFKDHRPDEQIHNYMLSGSTLSVLDQHPRDIPVSQLDLAATEKANREAGIDFRLPSASR
jgi:hypothetical protein